ncbi:MAG: TatD family hydrolase [Mollicutes bacterium PWAP]|nr:TatD family hydrolase [Mollicutes bacterium PWAP]
MKENKIKFHNLINNYKFIDTHTHIIKEYYENPVEIIKKIITNMRYLILPGTEIQDSLEVIQTSKHFDNVFALVGIHPNNVKNNNILYLKNINPNDVIGVGEVGYDFHYFSKEETFNLQKMIFEKHILWAQKYNKLVFIHSRESDKESYEMVKKYPDVTFIFHSYNQPLKMTKKYLNLKNIYFSLSGMITFKNSNDLRKSVLNIPLNRILLETDTPYLTPFPMRGNTNITEYVSFTYVFFAKLKNISLKFLILQVEENFERILWQKKK